MSNPLRSHSAGEPFPELKPGTLRLYSMRFCPYAQRTRLVLAHKGIPHEVINVSTSKDDKPDWFLARNPLGLVPVLEQDGKVIYESVICNDYLDDVYPNNKLRVDDPFERAKQMMLLEHFSKVVACWYKLLRGKGTEGKQEAIDTFQKQLLFLENQLKGKKYFAGDSLSMLDFNVWPHTERFGVSMDLDELLPPQTFPNFRRWMEAMKEVPAVKETMFDMKTHHHFFQSYLSGKPDFDHGLG